MNQNQTAPKREFIVLASMKNLVWSIVSNISVFWLVLVAKQAGLCLVRSETPKTVFLTLRPI